MHSTLYLADSILEWLARPGDSPDRRPLDAGDEARFRDWVERYRRVLKRLSPSDNLSALGQEVYDWLDGGALVDSARGARLTPPWIVDFVVPHLSGGRLPRASNYREALETSLRAVKVFGTLGLCDGQP